MIVVQHIGKLSLRVDQKKAIRPLQASACHFVLDDIPVRVVTNVVPIARAVDLSVILIGTIGFATGPGGKLTGDSALIGAVMSGPELRAGIGSCDPFPDILLPRVRCTEESALNIGNGFDEIVFGPTRDGHQVTRHPLNRTAGSAFERTLKIHPAQNQLVNMAVGRVEILLAARRVRSHEPRIVRNSHRGWGAGDVGEPKAQGADFQCRHALIIEKHIAQRIDAGDGVIQAP